MGSDIPSILKQYGLKRSHVYLLEIIPLIEVMWADGKNQQGEIDALIEIVSEHLGKLNAYAGLTVVPKADVDEFMHTFVYQTPDNLLLEELRGLLRERLTNNSKEKVNAIIDNCFDIAAACAKQYPYGCDERVEASEKDMIRKIVKSLHVDADQPQSF